MNYPSQNRQAFSEPNPVVVDAAAHLATLQLRDMPCPTGLRVPDPQFPNKVPAGRRRLSCPTPHPAPGRQLRWARCPDDGLLHLLQPSDVVVAAIGGHAEALCGRQLPAESLTPISGSVGALCMGCVAGIAPESNDPGPRDIP